MRKKIIQSSILSFPPRQFRRGLSNHLSSFHSQLKPSIVQTFSSPSFLSQFFQSTLLTSRRTDLAPVLSQPNVQLYLNFYTFYTAEIGYWQGEGRRTDDEGQRIAVRPARPTVFVYSVYFVVQFFASFAFFAAIYSQKRSELIVSTGLLAATSLHLARLCQAGNDLVQRIPWD